MNWRKIEATLLRWADSNGYSTYMGADNERHVACDTLEDFSLTDIAQFLAAELKPEQFK